jgi:glutamate synthase domain-containing protein 3
VDALTATELDCARLSIRDINAALQALPDGGRARLLHPAGRHNLAVGLHRTIDVEIDGHTGYYAAGLCDGPTVTINGFAGASVAENLMAGLVRVRGDASSAAAASAHGGTVVVEGTVALRAGISLKGGTLAVAGDAGPFCGFMAQAGTILVGGDAGEALGDSLYEAVIYVAGRIASLGADARLADLDDADLARLHDLTAIAAFDHVDVQNVRKVVSARELYHFQAHNAAAY